MSNKPINFTREAFFHPGNLGFLFCAMLAGIVVNDGLLSDLVLPVAIGLELLFLGIVPRGEKYRKSVRLRKMRERNRAYGEQELFDRLDQRGQKRFLVLKHISGLIKENFDKMSYTTQGMLESIHAKIEGLLSNYILNLDMLQRYHRYLTSSSPKKLKEEIDSFTREVEATESEKLKEIKVRRLTIMHKRLEKIDAAREKYSICKSQLETIEDTIRYIYEKSMTMTNPEEIGFQLDNLISELEETATMMEDIEDEMPPAFTLLQKSDPLQSTTKL
ncbi:MAG: hypothetical protein WD266_12280 [Balneolales bacterium]